MLDTARDKVGLLIALVCVACGAAVLAGCQEEQRNPARWDVGPDATVDAEDAADVGDASDVPDMGEEPENQSFLPTEQPSDTLCDGRWCWVHPRPFPYDINELGVVDGQVYGLARTFSFNEQIPIIWGEEIEIGPIYRPVYGGANVVDTAVGQDGWLALTADGTLYEFDTATIQGQVPLPPGTYTSLEGHSTSMFMVGTEGGGGYIQRGGDIVEAPNLPEGLSGLRMWPNGEVWQLATSAPQQPPAPDQRRWFKLPESKRIPLVPAHGVAIGPDPTSSCADQGVWASFTDGKLYKWQEDSSSWNAYDLPERSNTMDFTCHDGVVYATNRKGAVVFRDGQWRRAGEGVEGELNAVTSLEGTVYAAGLSGTMFEITDEETRRRGGRLLPQGVPDTSLGSFSEFWISDDEVISMFMGITGIHRVTKDGVRNVTPDDLESAIGGGSSRQSEIWGQHAPEYARSETQVFRWNGIRWNETALTADRPEEMSIVDISGVSGDDAWVATDRDLYHFHRGRWTHISDEGSQVAQVIAQKDQDITTTLIDSESGGYVALGSHVLELNFNSMDGTWTLQEFKTSPCNRVGNMYRSEGGGVWIAGTPMCVARLSEGDWEVFEPTFNWDPNASPGEQLPLLKWDFFEHPHTTHPLGATVIGVLKPTEDGRLEPIGGSNLVGATHISGANAIVGVRYSGIVARYD